MRTCTFVLTILGTNASVGSGSMREKLDNDGTADRVVGLITQLGDGKFARREAAGKELVAIGEPALSALRKASASPDPEVRTRAERVIGSITARAGERELAKLTGYWKTADGVWLEISGNRW